MVRRVATVVGKGPVGEVLARWMNAHAQNPTDMARRAQISRATVYVVLNGASRNPETMRQLAAGLAKRRDDDEVGDPVIERQAARDLLVAAGYGSLIVEYPVPSDAPGYDRSAALAEIEALVQRVPAASISLADLGRGAIDWDDEDVEYVLGRLRRLAERYGRSAAAC
jgi:hypothetical protein